MFEKVRVIASHLRAQTLNGIGKLQQLESAATKQQETLTRVQTLVEQLGQAKPTPDAGAQANLRSVDSFA